MTFTEPEIRRFLQAWNLVQRWHASRLEVDGVYATGMERFTLQRVLECMAKAAAFSPPQRYCHSTSARTLSSAAASASPGRPILIPCRLWASSWGTWGDVDWGDPGRRDDQVRASLADRGVTRCPFLTLEPLPHASGAADVSAADNVIPLRRRNPQAPAP
jgi:hypothetical protein